MQGKVIIGKVWINDVLYRITDILMFVKDDMYITEKGYIIMKENLEEIREE